MAKNHVTEFKEDLAEFEEITAKFYRKEISVADYKGLSGGFGSYAQRGGEASMLRLRLTGGEISKDTLGFLADSIDKYNISLVHLTTCQSLQFHNLKEAAVCSLTQEAFDHGIITRGGGGDYPRNVMVSPLSGVSKEEPFDVLPYAKEAADYLLGFIKTVKLPRKLKVCFSNSPENETHATFRDLGFVANADKTFNVYSAGGLGRAPMMGIQVASHISPEQILYYIKAMIDTFISYGNYQNRARSRTRFMQEDLGTEAYVKAYQEKLDAAFTDDSLRISVTTPQLTKIGSDKSFSHPRVIAQKQPGLYTVSYQPAGGNPAPTLFRRLYDAMLLMNAVAIRISPAQGMYFLNCTKTEALTLLDLTRDSAKTRFEGSVACIGATICQVGARDSQELLKACLNAVKEEHFADKVLPVIHISGCPSSCAAHQTGALGFRGGVKQTPTGPKPAFSIFESGCALPGREQFGSELGSMTVEDIPLFLVELGKAIALDGIEYEDWMEKNRDRFLKLVEKYSAV